IAQRGRVLQSSGSRNLGRDEENSTEGAGKTQSLLVLGVGPKRQVAMQMSQVARLEQVAKNLIEEADNKSVIQYRGKILPLIDLASILGISRNQFGGMNSSLSGEEGAEHDNLDESCQVVVHSEEGRSFGVVVDRIIDIVDAHIDLVESHSGSGVLGSAIVQDRILDLLDLPAVIQAAGHRIA
ncbi:MAG: chemotaxis protein CheW, partial [Rhodopirellula sp. JB055]|uniref:chemotaxis protein CheW n=1 Tax=Rhodopirellula sp. JB055 TaxID=3342846 RepID=UPI00370C352F